MATEEQRFGNCWWHPKKGKAVRFKNMGLPWLENVLAHCERVNETLIAEELTGWRVLSGLQGEEAVASVESQLDDLQEQSIIAQNFVASLRAYVRYRRGTAAQALPHLGASLAALQSAGSRVSDATAVSAAQP